MQTLSDANKKQQSEKKEGKTLQTFFLKFILDIQLSLDHRLFILDGGGEKF